MSSFLYTAACLNPLQGLIEFTQDAKPFRTKLIEATTALAFQDTVRVSIQEEFLLDIEQLFHMHTSNCKTPIVPCPAEDGFEVGVFDDHQGIPGHVLLGYRSLVSHLPTAVTLPTSPTNLTDIDISNVRDDLIVIASDTGYHYILSLQYHNSIPQPPIWTRISFEPLSNKYSYVVSGQIYSWMETGEWQLIGPSPEMMGAGFEPTINFRVKEFTDFPPNTSPSSANFVGFSAAGNPLFIVKKDCLVEPTDCLTGFELYPLDQSYFESTIPDCDRPRQRALIQHTNTSSCPVGFEMYDFDTNLFESASEECEDTCNYVNVGSCGNSGPICTDTSATTISTSFAESMVIEEYIDINNTAEVPLNIVDIHGSYAFRTIYSYTTPEAVLQPQPVTNQSGRSIFARDAST